MPINTWQCDTKVVVTEGNPLKTNSIIMTLQVLVKKQKTFQDM